MVLLLRRPKSMIGTRWSRRYGIALSVKLQTYQLSGFRLLDAAVIRACPKCGESTSYPVGVIEKAAGNYGK